MWKRLMWALRKGLYLFAIENDVAEIKHMAMNIKQDLADIKKAIEEQDLRMSALQAMCINHQHQQLEVTLGEFSKIMSEVTTLIADDRIRRDETDKK